MHTFTGPIYSCAFIQTLHKCVGHSSDWICVSVCTDLPILVVCHLSYMKKWCKTCTVWYVEPFKNKYHSGLLVEIILLRSEFTSKSESSWFMITQGQSGESTWETTVSKWGNVRLVILVSIFNRILCLSTNEKWQDARLLLTSWHLNH